MKLRTGREVMGRRGFSVEIEVPAGDRHSDYLALRHAHGTSSGALRCARVLERWRAAGDGVRLLYVADEDSAAAVDWLDASADDMAEGNAREWKAIGKRERERASSDGVFGLVGQRLVDGEWEVVDSVWGFIGEDGLDAGGYAADIMSEVLDAVEKDRSDRSARSAALEMVVELARGGVLEESDAAGDPELRARQLSAISTVERMLA